MHQTSLDQLDRAVDAQAAALNPFDRSQQRISMPSDMNISFNNSQYNELEKSLDVYDAYADDLPGYDIDGNVEDDVADVLEIEEFEKEVNAVFEELVSSGQVNEDIYNLIPDGELLQNEAGPDVDEILSDADTEVQTNKQQSVNRDDLDSEFDESEGFFGYL